MAKPHQVMSDAEQDSELTRGMTKGQLAAWKKADNEMDSKNLTRAQDIVADRKLAAKIRRTVR